MTMTADFSGKALAYTGTPTLVSFSPPALRRGEALIRLLYAGICNTDLEILQGYMGFTGIMGHEFVGVVTECGDADWVGRRVTGEINIPCGRCAMCRQGLGNHCPNRQVMGIQDRDGCFAPFFTLPLANLHRIPDSVPDRRAVFSEPLAAAFQPFSQHDFSRAAACLVLGDGKLGILQALAASHMFADCRLAGKHDAKLSLARELGITAVRANELPHTRFDVVFEATGRPEGLACAVSLLKPRGVLVLKTTSAQASRIHAAAIVVNELTVLGSRCGPFDRAIAYMERERPRLELLISAAFPLSQGLKALEKAKHPESVKVLLYPDSRRPTG